MAIKYTNIRKVIDNLMRHPLLQELSLETVVDYTVDFIRIVGVPTMFEEKTGVIEIVNYRGGLPIDFHEMIQVRDSVCPHKVYRYSTDSFHMSEYKNPNLDLTYKLQGNIIYTSTNDNTIEIAYRALSVDDCGFPLIPDNSSFTRALELYIKKQWFTILFDLGKINQGILQQTLRDYGWAVGDCQSEFNRMSIDQMESFCNSWRTLIVRANEHRTGFKFNGSREILKHN